MCNIFFDKKGVEFINIAKTVRDPHITSSLPTTSLKFPIPIVTYEFGFASSANIINFNQFVNTLDSDAFYQMQKYYNVIVMDHLIQTNIINGRSTYYPKQYFR